MDIFTTIVTDGEKKTFRSAYLCERDCPRPRYTTPPPVQRRAVRTSDNGDPRIRSTLHDIMDTANYVLTQTCSHAVCSPRVTMRLQLKVTVFGISGFSGTFGVLRDTKSIVVRTPIAAANQQSLQRIFVAVYSVPLSRFPRSFICVNARKRRTIRFPGTRLLQN